MSLATRCTHCGTIFKVVQDQLKVSEGWVRCGRCNEVFNALPSLFDLEKDPPPPRPAHLSVPSAEPESEPTPAREPEQEPVTEPESPPETPFQAEPTYSDEAPEPAPPAVTAPVEPVEAVEQPPAPRSEPSAPGVAIPLAAMSDVRKTAIDAPASVAASAPAPVAAAPTASSFFASKAQRAQPDPLAEQGLMADAEVDLGFDSKPPSAWAKTQPTEIGQQLDEEDLALEPPPAPIEATTDFELDTSIAVDDNTPLEAVIASMSPRRHGTLASPATPATPPAPTTAAELARRQADDDLALRTSPLQRAWPDEPLDNLPSTEEEDALDSRYLMPSPSRDRKPPRRLEEGPEFADAQFPSDAFLDAEEDWASDFGPSALDADAAAPMAAPVQAPAKGAPIGGLRGMPRQPDDDASAATAEDLEAAEDATEPVDQQEAAADSADQPEFLKHAQRRAFWRHPATRAVLSLLFVILLAGLGLQLAHQFRDLIAAHHPESRPVLARWCDIAGCEIKPPLRIEDLQVESATLVRAASEGPDSYRLAVVVHNKAPIGLAWPHVDLTLTDENGAVIARRVFSPQDAQWLDTADPKADTPADTPTDASADGQATRPVSEATPSSAPGQRSTTLQWRLLAPDIKPAGYTAELFYP
jgi:predicted Zn finger-like uncharacterized protein